MNIGLDPSLAAPIATLASAIATAILMYAAYHWPAGHSRNDRHKHDRDDNED